MTIEKMDEFFDRRAPTYDGHMLVELDLTEFYEQIAACFPARADAPVLLDLGCGTGLELSRLYEKLPSLRVTGIDLSRGMLDILRDKFAARAPQLVCGSYFDLPLGEGRFDYVLSTYSLHHFTAAQKTSLYRKIFAALRPGGRFVDGDYTCQTAGQQRDFLAQSDRLRETEGAQGVSYHIDTPFTAAAEAELMHSAGFSNVTLAHSWESTSILIAEKGCDNDPDRAE